MENDQEVQPTTSPRSSTSFTADHIREACESLDTEGVAVRGHAIERKKIVR